MGSSTNLIQLGLSLSLRSFHCEIGGGLERTGRGKAQMEKMVEADRRVATFSETCG